MVCRGVSWLDRLIVMAGFSLKAKPPAPESNRFAFSESNEYVMECKLAVCKLLLLVLDLLASEELDKVINNFFGADLTDHKGITEEMMLSLRESINNSFFVTLKERLLPILRQTLMYKHTGLVAMALSLLFRLSMLRSETTGLLQVALRRA